MSAPWLAPSDLRELPLAIHYEGAGEEILNGFVIPCLQRAIAYDRLTGFFSVQSLLAIAEGIEALWNRGGRMRLILGIHDVPDELARAASTEANWSDELIQALRSRLLSQASSIRDEFARDRLATIAWMMRDQLLEVKVAAPVSPQAVEEAQSIFHSKRFIFRDKARQVVTAVGSPNETVRGLISNFEEVTVHMSWVDELGYVDTHVASFERIWSDEKPGLLVRALAPDFAADLLRAVQRSAPEEKVAPAAPQDSSAAELIDAARRSPLFGIFNLTNAALFPHQERTFVDGMSRWPVRVMLADEVGLGKTLEAGAIIAYMLRFGGVRRVTILAPAGLLRQWQEELAVHFDFDFWRWDSASSAYVSSRGSVRVHQGGPLARSAPELTLISAQLARGSRHRRDLFDGAEALPELLVVDEAHAARLHPDRAGARPTRLWRLLDKVRDSITHLLLLTATPLQVHPIEFHGLLELLGLPTVWRDRSKYQKSLEIMSSRRTPSLQDAHLIVALITSAISETSWQPPTLSDDERALISKLMREDQSSAARAIAIRTAWPQAFNVLAKTHPAQLLTIRNTRRALERMGYRFPERVFEAPIVDIPEDVAKFYDAVHVYLRDAYGSVEAAADPSNKTGLGFAISSYHQRLVSSLYASRLSLQRRLTKIDALAQGEEVATSDEDDEDDEESVTLESPDLLDTSISTRVRQAATIERTYITDLLQTLERLPGDVIDDDPKFREALDILERHLGKDRTLVFSRYTDTLGGFLKAFSASPLGSRVTGFALYTGQESWIDTGSGPLPATKREVKVALDRNEVDVVFCSDAASEGLNLQAARVLINLDVPWNPARLEQRIGRIARLGQKAEVVEIYNLWYPNSIEARMYGRLLQRRDLYELAVGEFPELFSRAIRQELAGRYDASIEPQHADPVAALEELRRDHQHRALQAIWDVDVEAKPMSQDFRGELLSVIEQTGLPQTFSTQPGDEHVISLRHPVWSEVVRKGGLSDQVVPLFAVESGEMVWGFAIALSNDTLSVVSARALPQLLSAALKIGFIRQHDLDLRDVPLNGWREQLTERLQGSTRWLPKHEAAVIPTSSPVSPSWPRPHDLQLRRLGSVAYSD